MKFILIILALVVLAKAENSLENALVLADNYDDTFEKNNSIETLEKAGKCIVEGKNSVVGLVNIVKNLVAQNYIGAIINVYQVTKNVINMLDDCKTLFCFGPTFEKCESKHGAGNCEMTGLIVYPKCKQGFTNWDCCVCANQCPQGFRDDGLFCAKPAAYGRGAGYVLWQQSKCESQNPQGCEKNGLIWYPKCKPGFHNVGCCICSPNCPSGWVDIGVSCTKPESYGRGVGYGVSFGLQCLRDYNKEQKLMAGEMLLGEGEKETACVQEKEHILQLAYIVQEKLDKQEKNPKIYQSGLSDQIKQLAELTDMFAENCSGLQYEIKE